MGGRPSGAEQRRGGGSLARHVSPRGGASQRAQRQPNVGAAGRRDGRGRTEARRGSEALAGRDTVGRGGGAVRRPAGGAAGPEAQAGRGVRRGAGGCATEVLVRDLGRCL
jgi:hypothetical protein